MVEKKDDENPNAPLLRFRILEALQEKLKSKGIEALFLIQATTFDTILDGYDLIGQAGIGQIIKCCSFSSLIIF